MPVLSTLPTLSSSTPLTDWFANVNQMYHLVQAQSTIIQALQERVAVLESRVNIQSAVEVVNPVQDVNTKKVRKTKKLKDSESKASKGPKATKDSSSEYKKRGRKPAEVNLSEFLREGEQIIARVPLGDRRFDEHAVVFQDGKLTLEDGQTFDHPTTLVATLAKILEDIGERSPDCSRSMNGWILCTASRDGKRVALEKLKPAEAAVAEEATEMEA